MRLFLPREKTFALLCETSLDSCWPICPPCQDPPQSSTNPRFQLFDKLFVSSSKLLMLNKMLKMLNNTGSGTNLRSTPLVTGSCVTFTIVPSSPSHSSPLKGCWASQAWLFLHRSIPTTLNHVPVFSYIDLQKYVLHHLPRDWDKEDPPLALKDLLLILFHVPCPIQQQRFLLLLTDL